MTFVTLAGRNCSCTLCSYNIFPEDCSINIALPQVRFKLFSDTCACSLTLTLVKISGEDQTYEEPVYAKQEIGVNIKLKIIIEIKSL